MPQDTLLAKIRKIDVARKTLHIAFPDGNRPEGEVPHDHIFPGKESHLITSEYVYAYPVLLRIGQLIRVVPLGGAGEYSHIHAVEKEFTALKVDDTVSATICSMSTGQIFCVADGGYQIRIPYKELCQLLGEKTSKRLGTERQGDEQEQEKEWLYVRDRIRVSIVSKRANLVAVGRLLFRGAPLKKEAADPASSATELLFFTEIAPRSPYNDVLLVDPDEAESDKLEHFFDEGGYTTFCARDLSAIQEGRWYKGSAESMRGREALLAIVPLDRKDFPWRDCCEAIIERRPASRILFTCHAVDELDCQAAVIAQDYRSRGIALNTWERTDGLSGLAAIVSCLAPIDADSSSAQHVAESADGTLSPSKRGEKLEEDVRRQTDDERLRETCKSALCALLAPLEDAYDVKKVPCAALLFGIHRRSHEVRIVASAGADCIVNGFHRHVGQLHKSPIRDLGIHGHFSTTGNAAEHEGRFRFFLRAGCGDNLSSSRVGRRINVTPDSIDDDTRRLSVAGMGIKAPPGSPSAYVAFLFARKVDALADVPGLNDKYFAWVQRTIEEALLLHEREETVRRLTAEAERAIDYRYMAHEALFYVECLKPVMRTVCARKNIENTELADAGRRFDLLQRVVSQFRPGKTLEDEVFEPDAVIREMVDFFNAHRIDAGVDVESEQQKVARPQYECESRIPEGHRVRGRRLAIECVLRNVLLNAEYQIRQYHDGKGCVHVSARLTENREKVSVLEFVVSDDGPGIHAKLWDRIFEPGVTTRPKGTGLGLALSRRLLDMVKLRSIQASINIQDSFVYGGASFRIKVPVEDIKD